MSDFARPFYEGLEHRHVPYIIYFSHDKNIHVTK